MLLVSQSVAELRSQLRAIEKAPMLHFNRVRGGGTQNGGGEQTIVGVGIGLSKNATRRGHVVRRLASGLPAAESRQIFIKVCPGAKTPLLNE